MSIYYGLDVEAYDREYTDRELVRRVAGYFAPHRRQVLTISVLITVVALITAGLPIIISRGLDRLIAATSSSLIYILIGLVLAIGLLVWFATWVRRRLTVRVIGNVILTIRQDAFKASVNHDISFFDNFRSGRIISRITSDTQEFAQVVVLITDLIGQLMIVFILLIALLTVSWKLTLWLLILAPTVVLLATGFRRIARFVTRKGFQAIAEVNTAIQEAVTGISIAKNFRQEAAIYAEFSDVNQQSYGINLRRGAVLSVVFPTLDGRTRLLEFHENRIHMVGPRAFDLHPPTRDRRGD